MKVLMVCLGNICRSPVAEGILRSISDKRNLGIEVESAGTSSFHIGHKHDQRSMANAISHGVDISKGRSRQFEVSDFDDFDRIYAMDSHNYDDIMQLARDVEDESKVKLILNEVNPGENNSVPDPYYGNDGFENVFTLLNEACEKIASEI